MDAEAGDEYDSYLMYSNEVLKSPAGSKTPSVAGDGGYTQPQQPQAAPRCLQCEVTVLIYFPGSVTLHVPAIFSECIDVI